MDLFDYLKECSFNEFDNVDEETLQILQQKNKEFEEGKKIHHREDKTYTVQIRGDEVCVPPYCTCCMKPTTKTLTQFFDKGIGSLKMPICEECIKHIQGRELKIYLYLICIMAIVINGVSTNWLIEMEINGFLSFILANIISVVVYYLLSYIFRLRKLPSEHSARDKGVRIKRVNLTICGTFLKAIDFNGKISDLKLTEYTFSNWVYFYLFKKINEEQVTETRENDERNTANSMSVYDAYDDHKHNIYIILFINVVVGFFMACGYIL